MINTAELQLPDEMKMKIILQLAQIEARKQERIELAKIQLEMAKIEECKQKNNDELKLAQLKSQNGMNHALFNACLFVDVFVFCFFVFFCFFVYKCVEYLFLLLLSLMLHGFCRI